MLFCVKDVKAFTKRGFSEAVAVMRTGNILTMEKNQD